jgi:hypothetical protein
MSRNAGDDEVEEVLPTFGRGIFVVCLNGSPITMRRLRPLSRQPRKSVLRRKSQFIGEDSRLGNKSGGGGQCSKFVSTMDPAFTLTINDLVPA